MTDLSKAELKKRWGTMQKVVSSEPRARQIVDDILLDMETKPRLSERRGNAMLTSEPLEASVAERIAGVRAKATIRVPALAPMSGPARIMFVNHNLYEISRDNLSIALGPTTSLALDVAREANEGIYRYVTGANKRDLAELTRFAVQRGQRLDIDVVETLAANSVRRQDVVILMEPRIATLGRDRLFGVLRSLGGDYAELTSVGHDTPRIPNTPVNIVLLERLKQHGIVSTFDAGVNPIKVNKKRK
jgi:hypothetical protein